MSNLVTFIKKEIIESLKTFKFLIIAFVFIFFGLASPLMAKYMPQIIGTFDSNLAGVIPEPRIIDAYGQFFKNISQIAFIVMIIIFSGIVAQEKNKGTLVMILSKNIKRSTVILSKFIASSGLYTISYFVAVILCWIYSSLLFPGEKSSNMILSMGSMWLFGLLMISISILFSTLLKNSSMAAMGSFIAWIAITLIGSIPQIREYSPTIFTSKNLLIMQGVLDFNDLIIPAAISLIIIIGLQIMSYYIFSKLEI